MISKKDISFITPSRNNLKYLKWAYESIRKNGGSEPHICVADDFSNDGTWDWCKEMMEKDPNFHAIRNEGPARLGHTILYDRLINEVAPTKIVGIYHSDMYLCPGALESVLEFIKPQTVVSLTRIEPPLHPDGPEKILKDWDIEPERFNEDGFLEWFKNTYKPKHDSRTTEGIFAPWFLFKEDFQSIGGHDPLYAPQSKEDSDIFNRFLLNGYRFVQTWEGCVYHMTCRGSRFNPTLTTVGTNSPEWEAQNKRSTRNFIRKWGHFVMHDQFLKPIVPPKYNVGIVLQVHNYDLIELLEPWCDVLYIDNPQDGVIEKYIQNEQPNTAFDLKSRIYKWEGTTDTNTTVYVTNMFEQYDYNAIQQLSQIVSSSGGIGTFEVGNLKLEITDMTEYQNELIRLQDA